MGPWLRLKSLLFRLSKGTTAASASNKIRRQWEACFCEGESQAFRNEVKFASANFRVTSEGQNIIIKPRTEKKTFEVKLSPA